MYSKFQRKIIGIIIGIILFLSLGYFGADVCIPYFLGVGVVLGVCIANKKITDKKVWLLVAGSLLISGKSFFCHLFNYGIYNLPLFFVSFVVITKNYILKNDKALKTALSVVFVPYILVFLWLSYTHFTFYQGNYDTPKGKYIVGLENSPEKLLMELLRKNTFEEDRVVILPEGHIINFLTDRKSDDMYNNLIPMYVEAFGEQNIINHYSKNKPDYFVLSTNNQAGYGKTYICYDYAQELCRWIFDNYDLTYKIEGEPSYFVLKERK